MTPNENPVRSNPLKKMWQKKNMIIALMLIVAILTGLCQCLIQNVMPSTQMYLNYAGASEGLNPNSTRFRVYEYKSNEVMDRVIAEAGLEGKVDARTLAECITITPVEIKELKKEENATYKTSISGDKVQALDDDYYIPTTYEITFDSVKAKLEAPTAEEMLELICSVYKTYFLEQYGENLAMLENDVVDFSNGEPYLKLSSLAMRADALSRYVDRRIQENKTYESDAHDYTYSNLHKELSNLIEYEIPMIHAYILETGVSQDGDDMVALLAFRNLMESMNYDLSMANYDSDITGINIYDVAMSAVVMIPSVDEANEFYMSRTQTALDYLAKDADGNLQEASYSMADITDTDYIMQQIKGEVPAVQADPAAEEAGEAAPVVTTTAGKESNSACLTKVNAMLDNLSRQLAEITDRLMDLDSAYIAYKTQNYIMFYDDDASILKRIEVLPILAAELVLLLACVVVFGLRKDPVKKTEAPEKRKERV